MTILIIFVVTAFVFTILFAGRDVSASETSRVSAVSHLTAGKACYLYIWDAPSALLSRWCNHLQKDCIYEGRGGKKFVRIEPGSMLQLLHPCSRYSADRCLICGGNFRDHLTLWWYKRLYTPFDWYVDKVYNAGTINAKEEEKKYHRDHLFRKKGAFVEEKVPAQNQYVFHRRYVLEVSHILRGVTDKDIREKLMRRGVADFFPRVSENDYRYDIRSVTPSQKLKDVGYDRISFAVPAIDVRRIQTFRQAIGLFTFRELFLAAVESIIDLERIDGSRECGIQSVF